MFICAHYSSHEEKIIPPKVKKTELEGIHEQLTKNLKRLSMIG